jgi:hypothetical protein
MRFVLIICAALAIGGTGVAAQADAPLRLAVGCSRAPDPSFLISTRNVGAEPTGVVIGRVIANDKQYALGELVAAVRLDGGRPVDLKFIDLSLPAALSARLDPWLVHLPPGSAYSMTVLGGISVRYRRTASICSHSHATCSFD